MWNGVDAKGLNVGPCVGLVTVNHDEIDAVLVLLFDPLEGGGQDAAIVAPGSPEIHHGGFAIVSHHGEGVGRLLHRGQQLNGRDGMGVIPHITRHGQTDRHQGCPQVATTGLRQFFLVRQLLLLLLLSVVFVVVKNTSVPEYSFLGSHGIVGDGINRRRSFGFIVVVGQVDSCRRRRRRRCRSHVSSSRGKHKGIGARDGRCKQQAQQGNHCAAFVALSCPHSVLFGQGVVSADMGLLASAYLHVEDLSKTNCKLGSHYRHVSTNQSFPTNNCLGHFRVRTAV